MKLATLFSLVCLSAWAQSTPGRSSTQATPAQPAPAQPAPAALTPTLPNLPDDTVVAIFADGVKLTMGEFRAIYATLPAQNQQYALTRRKEFLEQWALMRSLTQLAEKQKLDQSAPYKQQLEYARMNILWQAATNDAMSGAVVQGQEVSSYYEANKENYKRVKVKAIYIAFGDSTPAGKKPLTEEQAKTKAAALLEQIRKGADFVKLVKENSDEETSRDRDGDFATLTPKDNIPDGLRAPIFALKPGEVTEPLRQPNGYYLLRAEEVTYRTLDQVRDELFTQLRQQKAQEWFAAQQKAALPQFPNAEFVGETFTIPIPAPAPAAK